MAINDGISLPKVGFISDTIASGASTAEIDLKGGTLCGVLLLADITSTTFTITLSNISGGTFVTLKDPEASGAVKTFTVGSSAVGYFPISPILTAGFRYCKIVFDSSETNKTIYIANRSME